MLAITQPTAGRHGSTGIRPWPGFVYPFADGPAAYGCGSRAAGHAQAMENTASMIERSAASFSSHAAGLHGVVRVSASEIIGTEVLPPLIAQIKEDYPQLSIELVLSNRMQDLLNREADIAVRMTTPVQEQLIARRLGSIEIGLHASPSYLARHTAPENIDDLFTHTLVGFDKTTPFILQALKQYPQLSRERFTVRTDSDVAQLNLIRAGAGIGMCQVQLARLPVPLERLMPDFFAFHLDTWLVMHEDLRHSKACKTVFDILAAGLQAYISKARFVKMPPAQPSRKCTTRKIKTS
jgi:DNA-binding transcriptional LysR family regulator